VEDGLSIFTSILGAALALKNTFFIKLVCAYIFRVYDDDSAVYSGLMYIDTGIVQSLMTISSIVLQAYVSRLWHFQDYGWRAHSSSTIYSKE
jgi:hypothetical protein